MDSHFRVRGVTKGWPFSGCNWLSMLKIFYCLDLRWMVHENTQRSLGRRPGEALSSYVFWLISLEILGDYFSSSALILAYQDRIKELDDAKYTWLQSKFNAKYTRLQSKFNALQASDNDISYHETLLDFNETKQSSRLFQVLDNMCRRQFLRFICSMNDHNWSIIDPECFDVFVELAPTVFPRLWGHLSNLRCVKVYGRAVDKLKAPLKARQVLQQMCALWRMRNTNLLKWWSLVMAVLYYGWGVGKTSLDAGNYWGHMCSSRTQDICLNILTKCIPEQ